ncbi:MAG: trypsin-like peptidase domain-containing protein [Candidatus Anammoxibacter sp.]
MNQYLKTRSYTTLLLVCTFSLLILFQDTDLFGNTASRRNKVVDVVEKVRRTVVSLSTERLIVQKHLDPLFGFRSKFFNRYFDDYYGSFEQIKVETPLGSGTIIDESGYIVTNEHVISRASNIKVMLYDGTELNAKLVSSDTVNDLAILKIDTPNPLHYIEMGVSDDLMIGETVIALGNPFGLGNSVTTGVISALHRTLNFGDGKTGLEYKDLIQTDALINPGNSGGPLVNINGKLIGINAAILNKAQGIGFAIPVNNVKRTLIKLFNFRKIKKLWVGIKVRETAAHLNGIEITNVENDSPAEKARLKTGDIISQINDQPIKDVLDYEKYILKKDVNDSINVTIYRDTIKKQVTVVLAKAPKPSGEKLALEKLGLHVQPLTAAIAKRLGIRSTRRGVLISEIEKDSPAGKAQILSGYVIDRIGPYRITTIEELGLVLNEAHSGEVIDIGLLWADSYGEHRGYARIETR